jgi:hypothetical protein
MSELKFNHSAETLPKSMNLDENELYEKLNITLKKFLLEKGDQKSYIFESIVEELSFSEIVYCAGMFMLNKYTDSLDENKKTLISLLKELKEL